MQGFPVKMTDRDSWSGPEAAGFYVFNSEAARTKFLTAEYATRIGPTPDFYVDYEKVPVVELTKSHVFDNSGKFYAEQLFETKRTQLI